MALEILTGSGPRLALRPHVKLLLPTPEHHTLSFSGHNWPLASKYLPSMPGCVLHWKPLLVFCLSHSVPNASSLGFCNIPEHLSRVICLPPVFPILIQISWRQKPPSVSVYQCLAWVGLLVNVYGMADWLRPTSDSIPKLLPQKRVLKMGEKILFQFHVWQGEGVILCSSRWKGTYVNVYLEGEWWKVFF